MALYNQESVTIVMKQVSLFDSMGLGLRLELDAISFWLGVALNTFAILTYCFFKSERKDRKMLGLLFSVLILLNAMLMVSNFVVFLGLAELVFVLIVVGMRASSFERRSRSETSFLITTQIGISLLLFVGVVLGAFSNHVEAVGSDSIFAIFVLGIWLVGGFFPFHFRYFAIEQKRINGLPAYMLVGPILIVVIGMFRFGMPLFEDKIAAWSQGFLLIGTLGMFFGTAIAATSKNLTRVVVCLWIAQASLIGMVSFSTTVFGKVGAILLAMSALLVLPGTLSFVNAVGGKEAPDPSLESSLAKILNWTQFFLFLRGPLSIGFVAMVLITSALFSSAPFWAFSIVALSFGTWVVGFRKLQHIRDRLGAGAVRWLALAVFVGLLSVLATGPLTKVIERRSIAKQLHMKNGSITQTQESKLASERH